MAFNTVQQVRDACGMGTSIPSDETIRRWQVLIDAMITKHNPDADASIAAIIEINRIADLYNQRKPMTGTEVWKSGISVLIKPLTPEEKELLGNLDFVDSIPMNGQRNWTGRR